MICKLLTDPKEIALPTYPNKEPSVLTAKLVLNKS